MNFASRLFCRLALALLLLPPAMAEEATVVSAVNTAGYTYIEINRDGKTQWLAAEVIDLKPGAQIRFDAGALMLNFHSSSLQRDFPSVMFVDQVKVVPEKK